MALRSCNTKADDNTFIPEPVLSKPKIINNLCHIAKVEAIFILVLILINSVIFWHVEPLHLWKGFPVFSRAFSFSFLCSSYCLVNLLCPFCCCCCFFLFSFFHFASWRFPQGILSGKDWFQTLPEWSYSHLLFQHSAQIRARFINHEDSSAQILCQGLMFI